MASEPDTPFCGEVVPPAHPPSDTRGGSALNISMLGYDAMRDACPVWIIHVPAGPVQLRQRTVN